MWAHTHHITSIHSDTRNQTFKCVGLLSTTSESPQNTYAWQISVTKNICYIVTCSQALVHIFAVHANGACDYIFERSHSTAPRHTLLRIFTTWRVKGHFQPTWIIHLHTCVLHIYNVIHHASFHAVAPFVSRFGVIHVTISNQSTPPLSFLSIPYIF